MTPIERALTEVLVHTFENDAGVEGIFLVALPELEKNMGVDTPERMLKMAAALIEAVTLNLDVRSNLCACCQRQLFNNWPAKMASDSLSSLPMKLRRIAASTEALVPPPPEEHNGRS